MARRYTQSLMRKFLVAVDSEGVALFQWVFYLIIAFDGAQNLFIAHEPPFTLHGSMGYVNFQWWCALEMAGPVLCLAGKVLHSSKMWRSANTLQLVGDLTLCGAELSYVTATFQIEPIGKVGHGGYIGLALCLSTLLLGLRDFRRMRLEAK